LFAYSCASEPLIFDNQHERVETQLFLRPFSPSFLARLDSHVFDDHGSANFASPAGPARPRNFPQLRQTSDSPISAFPRSALLPFPSPPAAVNKAQEPHKTPSVPRYNSTLISTIPMDPLRNRLSTISNGELRPTGNVVAVIRSTFDLQSVLICLEVSSCHGPLSAQVKLNINIPFDGTSLASAVSHFSARSHREAPANRELSPALLSDELAMSCRVSPRQSAFTSMLVVPLSPEPGLESRHRVYNADHLSNQKQPGPSVSLFRISVDHQSHDTSTHNYPEAPTTQPIGVFMIRSHLAPSLPSTHFAAPGSWTSSSAMDCRKAPFTGLDLDHPLNSTQAPPPPTRPSNGSCAAPANDDAISQNVKHTATSRPQSPLPCLLPGLLDPVAISSDEMGFCENDSPCAPQRLRKSRRADHYGYYSRPRDIPRLDYGLPEDFGKRA
jgi:hypothetical protein